DRYELARPERVLVLLSLEDGHVPLHHLDAGAAERREDLRVPRVGALVRPPGESLQPRTSSTRASLRSSASSRSSFWASTISLISPSEANCIPTTTSSTPRRSSGR